MIVKVIQFCYQVASWFEWYKLNFLRQILNFNFMDEKKINWSYITNYDERTV